MAQSNTHEPVRISEDMEPYYKYTGPFADAVETASHYGFRLVKPLEPSDTIKKALKKETGKSKKERTDKAGEWYIDPADKLAEVEAYIENMNGWEQPVMVSHTLHPRRKIGKVRLSVFGSTKSIAEGLAIKAALDILSENEHDDLCVDINSVGTQESRQEFLEDFRTHYRDNLNDLGDCCQTQFKHDACRVIQCDNDACQDIRDRAPQAITYLTDETRQHFKECIEYIETLDYPYRINNQLIGSEHHDSHVLFQIKNCKRDSDGEITGATVVARGERHEHLPKKLGYNRCLPTVSLSIDLPGERHESFKQHDPEEMEHPKVYYLHLGVEAKRKSLPVLEQLRKEGIRIIHSLSHDGLSRQMQKAKDMKVPYALIMGLKEAQEDSIIVRDMFTRAQETVPVDQAATRLKTYLKNSGGR